MDQNNAQKIKVMHITSEESVEDMVSICVCLFFSVFPSSYTSGCAHTHIHTVLHGSPDLPKR